MNAFRGGWAGCSGHDVRTVRQMNWLGLGNGRLLDAAADFDVFITVDKNLVTQQEIAGRSLAVIVLRGRKEKVPATNGTSLSRNPRQ